MCVEKPKVLSYLSYVSSCTQEVMFRESHMALRGSIKHVELQKYNVKVPQFNSTCYIQMYPFVQNTNTYTASQRFGDKELFIIILIKIRLFHLSVCDELTY